MLLEAAGSAEHLESMVARRVAGEPLEYIVGWVEFCGLCILIDNAVFVPRQRTTYLVHSAVAQAARATVIVDLCCGTGAIGAALAASLPDAEVWATDIDERAVRNARRNLDPSRVVAGDLFDGLPAGLRGRVDILAVNAPYVPTDAIALMPPEARLFESHVALDGGVDGLDIHRRVAAHAAEWLAPGGMLFIEVSDQQAPVSAALFSAAALEVRVDRSEEHDASIVIAMRRRREES